MRITVLGGAAVVLLAASSAHAALIGLVKGNPDVNNDSFGYSYVYTSGTNTGVLSENTGVAEGIRINGVHTDYSIGTPAPVSGSFLLSVTMTPGTGSNPPTLVSGSLMVKDPLGNILLASTNIKQFGFTTSTGAPIFDMIWGASATSTQDPTLKDIGVIFSGGTVSPLTAGNYDSTFKSTFTGSPAAGVADVFVIPEPATLAIVALAAGGALLRRRRRVM